MNVAFYIPTYNRPKILEQSLASVLNNTEVSPSEVWIIDDGSSAALKRSLLEFSLQSPTNINLLIHGKNMGIGYAFERIYNLMRQSESLDVACIIESDYIWRKDWLRDCLDVFEASPYTVSISAVDHPDYYDKNKTQNIFPEIMKEFFGKDLESRQHLFNPFELETNSGKIKVQGTSNTCGCQIFHWGRFKKIIKELEDAGIVPINDYWRLMDRAFNKGVTHDTRKNASDGVMSSTVSFYAEQYMKLKGVDITKNFGILSICDYSPSQHVCGQGVNGMIVPEGVTFVSSPTWRNEYLNENPRKKI
jgi:glycosyltransferase involved in cell wall biosynthesis